MSVAKEAMSPPIFFWASLVSYLKLSAAEGVGCQNHVARAQDGLWRPLRYREQRLDVGNALSALIYVRVVTLSNLLDQLWALGWLSWSCGLAGRRQS
ncbi:hypothetical protein BU16DRAFT_261182 [Lophium mytilinum]|uniref:Secreted protein n=1 Tax=Lophium mytilinum TaxID=390894 RepID=A0A6A6R414_9PEZI|nr:hypothetical protein BU16DRAFT_261182 [Lophium mytilinum]